MISSTDNLEFWGAWEKWATGAAFHFPLIRTLKDIKVVEIHRAPNIFPSHVYTIIHIRLLTMAQNYSPQNSCLEYHGTLKEYD